MEFIVKKITKLWDTPKNLEEKINELKRKLEELNALKEDTESRKSTELLHPRKKLKKEVELWFRSVERINSEIQDLEQEIGESTAVLSRGLFKGNVSKKIQEVQELFQQGKSHNSLIVDNAGWIGQALSMTNIFGDAAKICMEQIWAHLMDDDIQKIGVWGMGGIGKTTIMKLIHNQLLKETEKFDKVMWITVSKEMNIFKLQDRIARAMGVTFYEDEDEDETIRAGVIRQTLDRQGKYVLILDDLWDKLPLEEVGIPEPSNGSKLLVTTRLLDVCHQLDCQEVKVPTLSKADGLKLFWEKIGQDISNHPDLLPFVESVAEECAGLPLAIVTIAGSMKGVRDICEWRNAVYELNRNVKSVNEMEEKAFQRLRFSYDHLGDEKVKQCFLCCALYPEDYEIDTNELIKLWIAEELVEEMDSMQMEVDRGHTILNKLKNSCLIEKGIEFEDRVKLHDVLRDMALRITSVSPRFLVRAGMQLEEIPNVKYWNEDLEKASLMENLHLQIPYQMPPPKCQKLTTLLLSNCDIKSIPECFFEQMHGLKILDLSGNAIKRLPNSISNLETLTTLLLRGCDKLQKVPSVSKLQALKKLDLNGTNIKYIPHGMKKLVNLKYLNLSGTSIKEIPDGILGKLTSLQQLALNTYYKTLVRGEEIGGLRKLELFEGRFYELEEFKSYGKGLLAGKRGPREYYIYVGHHLSVFHPELEKFIELCGCVIFGTYGDMKVPNDVEELIIMNCTVYLCEEGAFLSCFIPVPLNIFSALSRITIYECKYIKKLFSSNWVSHNLQNLCSLAVVCCEEMEEIIVSGPELEAEGASGFEFTLPKLLSLKLWGLPELESICGANGVMVCDSIETIEIRNCPNLKRIPLNLPLQDDGQPSPPPSLQTITVSPEEWWELAEWDHPNAKSLLEPYTNVLPVPRDWEGEIELHAETSMLVSVIFWFEKMSHRYRCSSHWCLIKCLIKHMIKCLIKHMIKCLTKTFSWRPFQRNND